MQGWAPIGVVAAIVPWNFPLMLLSWKVCVCKEEVWELASYPGSRWVGKERAWYTLFAHAFNLP